jgi:hypothetical protein
MIKKFFKSYKNSLLIILFSFGFGLVPLVSLLLASTIANIGDCTLHEGYVNPCNILGLELGGILYGMGMAGWYLIVSIRWGLLGLLLGITLFIAEIFKIKL